MTDPRDSKPPFQPEILPPPASDNIEQDDEPEQAQTFAEQSLFRTPGDRGLNASSKAKSALPDDEDDVEDIVDHMVAMDQSGVLDYSAYRGERSDDDEEDNFGPGGIDDDSDDDGLDQIIE